MTKTRIFFTCDVHGSEVCFRKFISAGRFYKANVVILGGDLTGKRVIPVVEQPNGVFMARFLDKRYILKTPEELNELEKLIRASGCYPYRVSQEEASELSDKSKLDEVFLHLMTESIRRWVSLAEEHLRGTGIKCFVMPGNDDHFELDSVLEESDFVLNPEGKVVEIDRYHEMISTGYSNITPWKCPRDVPEDELRKIIDKMTSQVNNMENCIFNFHCPPFDSGLDMAPELDENLKPIVRGGQIHQIPVGSITVDEEIKKFKPLLGLHGHIHESKGVCRIGRTLCLNPGSEYTEGVLRGAIINVDEEKVRGYMLTSG